MPSGIQFHGRWDLDSPGRYITHWCGSSLCFQTTSRAITVEIGEGTTPRSNFHNVLWRFGTHSITRTALIKGNRSMKLIAQADTTEAEAGGERLRDVTIMLCDWGAKLHILDITATDGKPIFPPAVASAQRPILFIGDSLVSGYTPPQHGLILPHGSYQAFGSIAVRTVRSHGVDARLEMVAYPGIHLVSTYGEQGMEDVFWEGMHGTGGWDERSKDTPQDIFICLGSNDQGSGGPTDDFLEHYKVFLIRLRDSYSSELRRIHVISPFGIFKDPNVPESRLSIYEPDVKDMVEELSKSWLEADADGVLLRHISTDGWIDRELTCDGLHPTADGHETVGNKLLDYMNALGLGGTVPGIQHTGAII
ncbi:hypothetical protein BU17DRAFT_85638 [Hysterangium stoloniferum]|nr:hypothetical protein BU17DRAFT_85638 [Hysterangium stoloniferum]